MDGRRSELWRPDFGSPDFRTEMAVMWDVLAGVWVGLIFFASSDGVTISGAG